MSDPARVIRIRARDRLIIRAVNDCQVLQIHQIQALFFGSKSPAYQRVKILADNGFLRRLYVPQVGAAPAASHMVFTLGEAGAQVLAEHFDYDESDFNYASRQVKDWRTLQHILKVNDVRVAITRACAEQPHLTLVEWRAEQSFRRRPDYVTVSGRGRSSQKPVYPDAYCLIHTPGGYAHCFIEADRGTEGHKQFRSQVQIYQAYISSGLYQQRFETSSLRILVVTTGQKRLLNLRSTTAKAGGGDQYWFTTYSAITPQTVLSAPIWVKARDTGIYAFYTAG